MPTMILVIRIAKLVALFAGFLTFLDLVLITGWQTITFLNDGSWPALQLSSIVKQLRWDRGAIYETASTTGDPRSPLASPVDSVLQIPAIIPLLVALAMLVVFFLWLSRIEKQYS